MTKNTKIVLIITAALVVSGLVSGKGNAPYVWENSKGEVCMTEVTKHGLSDFSVCNMDKLWGEYSIPTPQYVVNEYEGSTSVLTFKYNSVSN